MLALLIFFLVTGKRRKVYDPDYEHVESAKFKEYERLEGDGYDETLKDPDSGMNSFTYIIIFTEKY